jgi:hypothetical protein
VRLKIVSGSPIAPYERLIHDLQLEDRLTANRLLSARRCTRGVALSPVDCDGLPLKMLNYMATGRIMAFGDHRNHPGSQTGLVIPTMTSPRSLTSWSS